MNLRALLEAEREMAYNGRVHPGCVNSGNPYHECGVACLEKIAQGHGQKEKKKSGNRHGMKGELSKKMDRGRKTDQSCPKASNPYHECNKYCSYNSAEAVLQGVEKKSGFQNLDGFQRKKKLSESQQRTEQVVNSVLVVKSAYPNDTASPRSPYTIEKKIGLENNQSYSSSLHPLEESHFRNHSFDQGRVQPHEVVPPDGTKISFSWCAVTPPIKQDEDEEIYRSLKGSSSPVTKIEDKNASGPINESSGIFRASEGSNGGEIQFVISDSCVSVGKYHVRATVASILQLIFEKYGDIAANSRLESTSLHAYYLECVCFVVQKLQSTSFKKLTKSKIKEMLAVLKDVESAGIDISWLHSIFNQLTEAMELKNQHETTEAARHNCIQVIESTRQELESMMKDLAEKERAVADIKSRISEATAHLNELELESSQLNNTLQSIKSKIEKIRFKPLGDEPL
ncbi:hypothetical protein K2173_012535 [Erythroxylum novogranatense]|uniref:Phospholipase-like protein n=1 Tax=Erythroxylum novogranatense TaxID=1862640 RepID=A0AAV8TM61_9ROSI|nr:hypothetical protein K2173_012535 [Erythroxylum novogranatense]